MGCSGDPASQFCNLFAAWILIAAGTALYLPGTLAWIDGALTTKFLITLSFLVGTTTKPGEFSECMKRPRPIVVNFLATFLAVPLLAVSLVRLGGLSEDVMIGMVILGCVSGGTSSNIVAMIADADVPLSVLMTSTTTLGSVVCTPLLAKFLLGSVVPVDTAGILYSAVQVVLAPIALGVLSGAALPRTCRALKPAIPVFGVTVAALIVGGILSRNVDTLWASKPIMHVCVVALHLIAGAFGYACSASVGGDERERRTVALEVGMKNCAFASVLATKHFASAAVVSPCAASLLWCPLLASLLAVVWKSQPAGPAKAGKDARSLPGWSSHGPDCEGCVKDVAMAKAVKDLARIHAAF